MLSTRLMEWLKETAIKDALGPQEVLSWFSEETGLALTLQDLTSSVHPIDSVLERSEEGEWIDCVPPFFPADFEATEEEAIRRHFRVHACSIEEPWFRYPSPSKLGQTHLRLVNALDELLLVTGLSVPEMEHCFRGQNFRLDNRDLDIPIANLLTDDHNRFRTPLSDNDRQKLTQDTLAASLITGALWLNSLQLAVEEVKQDSEEASGQGGPPRSTKARQELVLRLLTVRRGSFSGMARGSDLFKHSAEDSIVYPCIAGPNMFSHIAFPESEASKVFRYPLVPLPVGDGPAECHFVTPERLLISRFLARRAEGNINLKAFLTHEHVAILLILSGVVLPNGPSVNSLHSWQSALRHAKGLVRYDWEQFTDAFRRHIPPHWVDGEPVVSGSRDTRRNAK